MKGHKYTIMLVVLLAFIGVDVYGAVKFHEVNTRLVSLEATDKQSGNEVLDGRLTTLEGVAKQDGIEFTKFKDQVTKMQVDVDALKRPAAPTQIQVPVLFKKR